MLVPKSALPGPGIKFTITVTKFLNQCFGPLGASCFIVCTFVHVHLSEWLYVDVGCNDYLSFSFFSPYTHYLALSSFSHFVVIWFPVIFTRHVVFNFWAFKVFLYLGKIYMHVGEEGFNKLFSTWKTTCFSWIYLYPVDNHLVITLTITHVSQYLALIMTTHQNN